MCSAFDVVFEKLKLTHRDTAQAASFSSRLSLTENSARATAKGEKVGWPIVPHPTAGDRAPCFLPTPSLTVEGA
jgi:hypothetical protein